LSDKKYTNDIKIKFISILITDINNNNSLYDIDNKEILKRNIYFLKKIIDILNDSLILKRIKQKNEYYLNSYIKNYRLLNLVI
jgi:hypothetical protein